MGEGAANMWFRVLNEHHETCATCWIQRYTASTVEPIGGRDE